MLRLAVEMFIAAGVGFLGTLGPLTDGGLTPSEWMAGGVAALTAAGALLRQQPKKR
jgi:hypothetical protein